MMINHNINKILSFKIDEDNFTEKKKEKLNVYKSNLKKLTSNVHKQKINNNILSREYSNEIFILLSFALFSICCDFGKTNYFLFLYLPSENGHLEFYETCRGFEV